MKKSDCTNHEVETKGLISRAVTTEEHLCFNIHVHAKVGSLMTRHICNITCSRQSGQGMR